MTGGGCLVGLAYLVGLVSSFVWFLSFVEPNQLNKQDKPNKRDKQGSRPREMASSRGAVGIMPQYIVTSPYPPQMRCCEKCRIGLARSLSDIAVCDEASVTRCSSFAVRTNVVCEIRFTIHASRGPRTMQMEPAMNGTSGFEAGCVKLCRARLAGKARHARIRSRRLKAEGRKLRTQNSAPRTQNFSSRTFHHTYRFLHEQRHRFGTGAWHLLHTHDLITLSAGFSTKREAIPDTIHRSHTTMREGGSQ